MKRYVWKLLVKDKVINFFKCIGRIQGYKLFYLEEIYLVCLGLNKVFGGG